MTIAAVVISLHVLGQVGLNFQVSVPQILAAVGTDVFLNDVLEFVEESVARVHADHALFSG